MLTMTEAVPKEIVRDWVSHLEAFKGRNFEDCAQLIEALTEFVFRNGFGRIGAEEVNKLVQDILAGESAITPTKIEPTITAKFLADQIRPWVEDIREALFSTRSAPFSCIEDAEAWLDETERKVDKWSERVDKWIKQRNEQDAYLCVLVERHPSWMNGIEAWGDSPAIAFELPTVEPLMREKLQHLMSLKPGKPPEQDERVESYKTWLDNILEIYKATGFTVKSIEMYILADVLPVLPPFRLAIINEPHLLPSGKSLLNRYAKVTIRGDITEKDLRPLHRRIRRELGIRRSKSLSEQNIRLCEMVAQRGGIPEEGVMAFWESVKEEWNKRYRGKYRTYTSVQGPQIAYKRTIARLERRMIQKGGTK